MPTTSAPTPRPATAAALVAGGATFAAYPMLRPYADETTLDGARAVASSAWIASHALAMVSFGLLAAGLWGLARHARSTPAAGAATVAAVAMALGTGLVLPYYGAETFGLHAVAAEALRRGDVALLEVLDDVRFGAVAATTFGLGLVLIAAAGVAAAVAAARLVAPGPTPPARHRWVGVPLAVALVTLLPQFLGPPAVRIAHGLVVLAGSVLLATVVAPARRRRR